MRIFKIKAIRLAAVALAALAAFGLGWHAGGLVPEREPELEAGRAHTAETVGAEPLKRVTLNTKVEWLLRFSACGHTEDAQGESLVGMSQKEIADAYPGHEIEEFSERRVVISYTAEGCCHRHIYAKLEGNALHVRRAREGTAEFTELMQIDADKLTLTEEFRRELEAGMTFESLEEINSCFESIES